MSTTGPDDREAIRSLLRKINDAWVNGRPDDLAEYFHEDMVIVAPRFQGAGTCLSSAAMPGDGVRSGGR